MDANLQKKNGDGEEVSYTRKVLIAVGVGMAAVLLAGLVYFMAQLLVVCFAGVLFSVFLSAPADLLAKHGHMRRGYGLVIVVGTLFFVVVGGGYFLGSRIYMQGVELARTLPGALSELEHDLYKYVPAPREEVAATAPATRVAATEMATTEVAGTMVGVVVNKVVVETGPATTQSARQGAAVWMADRLIQVREAVTDFLFSETFVHRAGGVVSTTFGVIGNLVIVFGLGILFAVSPGVYSRGAVLLVPVGKRERVRFILGEITGQLQWWFVGQMCSMVTVGVLVFVGLSVLGVPMAFTLAILAGLLNFVPYVGPVCAAVLGVLVAFAPSGDGASLNPHLAGMTLGLYATIQILDGWVFTPFYQKRAVNVPAALIVIAQIGFSLLLGPVGLILATPILACVMVLVRTLYIEDVLGDRMVGAAAVKVKSSKAKRIKGA